MNTTERSSIVRRVVDEALVELHSPYYYGTALHRLSAWWSSVLVSALRQCQKLLRLAQVTQQSPGDKTRAKTTFLQLLVQEHSKNRPWLTLAHE